MPECSGLDVLSLRPSCLGYEVCEDLGSGALGEVKLGVCPRTGESVALKLINRANASTRQIEQATREASALRALRGAPHVLQLRATEPRARLREKGTNGASREVFAMVTELAENGDLFELTNASGPFSEAAAKAIFSQLLDALRSLDERGIVAHRDLKLENVLVGSDGELRVADFNLCARTSGGGDGGAADDNTAPPQRASSSAAAAAAALLHTPCGSRSYMAPEVIAGRAYHGAPADAWSAAVMLFTLLVGHPPFEEASKRCWFYRKACVEPGKAHLFWGAHGQQPGEPGCAVSLGARALLERLLVAQPADRASLESLSNDAWLRPADGADGVAVVAPLSAEALRAELERRAALVPHLQKARAAIAEHRATGRASPCGVEDECESKDVE